ncbi:MAG: hypothetical protein Q8S24_10835 [Eubacteriales bacterium]|nr:hypothetical protein [Eubacteriales bacterium]
MITSNYLKSILPELEEFNNIEIDFHIQTAEGYDGVIALLENIRTTNFPCLVIEDRSMGNIAVDAGPLDTYSIPLWVMVQDPEKSPTEQFKKAFELVKKILKILIRDADNDIIKGLDYSRIPYNKRTAIDSFGYEILLTFRMDIDLSS